MPLSVANYKLLIWLQTAKRAQLPFRLTHTDRQTLNLVTHEWRMQHFSLHHHIVIRFVRYSESKRAPHVWCSIRFVGYHFVCCCWCNQMPEHMIPPSLARCPFICYDLVLVVCTISTIRAVRERESSISQWPPASNDLCSANQLTVIESRISLFFDQRDALNVIVFYVSCAVCLLLKMSIFNASRTKCF